MGYTTDFEGQLLLTPTATAAQVAYINAFAGSRRMKRDAEKASLLPDPIRGTVGLPIGTDGGYFVGAAGENWGQNDTPDVIDHNEPPGCPTIGEFRNDDFMKQFAAFDTARKSAIANGAQPGLWCKWVLTEDGQHLEWNEHEKFYDYVEWLQYLIDHFFKVWGITLNGEIEWQGEDPSDFGKIIVKDNDIQTLKGKRDYVAA